MSYAGKWIFHSMISHNDDNEIVYLNAEEYLKAPMPYVDESDEEAVADEMKERNKMINMQIKICEDGKLYMLAPLPEGVPQSEVDKAVAAGIIKLVDGMMADDPMSWEERDGALWYDTGISGELFGEATDSWVKGMDEDGLFVFMATRFAKAD